MNEPVQPNAAASAMNASDAVASVNRRDVFPSVLVIGVPLLIGLLQPLFDLSQQVDVLPARVAPRVPSALFPRAHAGPLDPERFRNLRLTQPVCLAEPG